MREPRGSHKHATARRRTCTNALTQKTKLLAQPSRASRLQLDDQIRRVAARLKVSAVARFGDAVNVRVVVAGYFFLRHALNPTGPGRPPRFGSFRPRRRAARSRLGRADSLRRTQSPCRADGCGGLGDKGLSEERYSEYSTFFQPLVVDGRWPARLGKREYPTASRRTVAPGASR